MGEDELRRATKRYPARSGRGATRSRVGETMYLLFGLGFLLCDMVLAGLLIVLLVRGERVVPRPLQRLLPLTGRWLWAFLVTVVALLHLGLGVPFLLLLWRR